MNDEAPSERATARWGGVIAVLIVAAIVVLVLFARGPEDQERSGRVAPGRGRPDRGMTVAPMNDQVPVADEEASRIREPSLLDAIIPVVTLVGLIGLTIWLFGTDATGGPLQVALLTSTMVAGFVALKNGHTVVRVREAVVGGISSALSAVFILLAVGSLIGAWNMAGHDPDRRLLRHRAAERDLVLRRDGDRVRAGRAGHRQLVDHRRHPRRRVRGPGPDPRRGPGDRGRRGDLGRLLRRQDDADLRDDRPRAVDGRRRDDPGAHRRHALDVGAGHRPVDPWLRDHRPDGRAARHGLRPERRAGDPGRRSSTSRCSTWCRWCCSSCCPSAARPRSSPSSAAPSSRPCSASSPSPRRWRRSWARRPEPSRHALDRDLLRAGHRVRVEQPATRRSTRCSRAAGWRRCSTRSGSCSARSPSPRSWRTPGSSSG